MNPAEYDTLIRRLGLSVSEAAALHGVEDRTVRRWCTGERAVPEDAVETLRVLETDMAADLENILRTAEHRMTLTRHRSMQSLAEHEPAPHLPLGAHAMMIAWAAEALASDGVAVSIEWATNSEP